MSWALLAQILSMTVTFKNVAGLGNVSRRVAITLEPSQGTCQSH